jgi:hypothetical protein
VPKKFYSQTPVVPEKQIAGKNPIPGPALGGYASPTVPETPGVMHGIGTLAKPFKHGVVRGSHGYGHPPHAKKGNYRLSGHPNAHQLGSNRGKPYNVGRP